MNKKIKPIAIPGIHERFYKLFLELTQEFKNPRILEVGAGHGAFTKKLWDKGYDISACDLFPEIFYFNKVQCKKVDITKKMPYGNNTFDIIIAIEIMEHIHDHETFFSESYRILKPKGFLLFSTPNILSLKSRIRFLFSGFYYSFKPLDHKNNDGLQHVSALTVDQYNNLGIRYNFKKMDIFIDKRQSTSKFYLFFIPILWLYCKIKSINYKIHNKFDYLTGRILFIVFKK